eukprot:CAMPEP_0195521194 /NCGR_PEP_ID=MMETSP0794_2-20130614/18199_1 /TAXON_ID=515487 /ORGANISM="Stephanopyxis turris, Strain CCMP 815" /LENGTH=239 /DNA_ID=CAMNT_0040650701 /DNA_START=52 /DNA_END=771 /DNA_ORIENTATION=-
MMGRIHVAVLVSLLSATSVTGFATLSSRKPLVSQAYIKTSSSSSQLGVSNFLDNFNFGKKEEVKEVIPELPDVVIDADYKLAAAFLSAGVLMDTIPYVQLLPGPIVTALGVLFLIQTTRIRFVFDKDSFELKTGSPTTLKDAGENIIVGGANKWKYDSFVNYDFFPKGWVDQPQGPILVYFKETQTPDDQWNAGPGASANSEEAIANGALPGQVHFFPALCNTQQLKAEFERRGCAKLE